MLIYFKTSTTTLASDGLISFGLLGRDDPRLVLSIVVEVFFLLEIEFNFFDRIS